MFISKIKNNKKNICGERIREFRQNLPEKITQKRFAEMLCSEGLDMDATTISSIENGERIVTDIELRKIAQILNVAYTDLLDDRLIDFSINNK